MTQTKLQLGATLRDMGASFEANRPLFVRVTFLFAVFSAVSAVLEVNGTAGLAIWVGLTILLGAAYVGMVTTLLCVPGKSQDLGDLWATTKPVLARLIWVAVVGTLAVVVGMFALIIPGLIIATIWSVASQAVVVEGRSVFESLGRSRELVRNNGLRAFGYLVIVGILGLVMIGLALLVSAPLGDGLAGNIVGNFLTDMLSTPIFALGTAVLYNALIDIERSSQPGVEAEKDPYAGVTAPEPKD